MVTFLIATGIVFIGIFLIMFLFFTIFNKIDKNRWNSCKNKASEKCNLNNFECIKCPYYDRCLKK